MAVIPFLHVGAPGNHARFATAHTARSLGWAMTDLLLAWQMHAVVGFSGVAVSILLTILLSIGALANFGVSYWLTATRATAPAYVRLQLVGSIATAVLLAGQFLVRDAIAVTIIAIAFRIAFAMQDVPQSALGSLLPIGDGDAKHYAGLRVMLSGITRLLAISLHLLLLHIDRDGADAAIFMVIGGMNIASALALRKLRFPLAPGAPPVRRAAPRPWPEGLPRLLFAFAVTAAILPTVSRLLIFTPGMTAPMAQVGSWMLVAFCAGSVAGPLVQRRLARASCDRDALLAGIILVVASAAVVTFARDLPIRVTAAAAHGVGLNIIGVHLWTSAARIAMRDAERGPRRDGLVAGGVILTTHLSMAIGSLLLAPLIDDYEAGNPTAALAALMIVGSGATAVVYLLVRWRSTPAIA